MKHVVDVMPNALLLIAGNGPKEARLRALTRQLDLHNHVRLLGSIPHDLRRYYNLADVFLMAGHEVPGDV